MDPGAFAFGVSAPDVVSGGGKVVVVPTFANSHPPVLAYAAPADVFVKARGQAAIVCSATDARGGFFGYFGSFDF